MGKETDTPRPPEPMDECGNCPHIRDDHSTRGAERCGIPWCLCPGFLTVRDTPRPSEPHIPKPTDICEECGNGLVHIDAARDAPLTAKEFHDAWTERGMVCAGTHTLGEALCQNVTATLAALASGSAPAPQERKYGDAVGDICPTCRQVVR